MQCNYLNPERKMFASKSGSSRFSRFSFQIHSTPGVGRLPALHGAWGRPVAPGPEVQPASSTDSPGLFLFLFLFFIGCAESLLRSVVGRQSRFLVFSQPQVVTRAEGRPLSLPPFVSLWSRLCPWTAPPPLPPPLFLPSFWFPGWEGLVWLSLRPLCGLSGPQSITAPTPQPQALCSLGGCLKGPL